MTVQERIRKSRLLEEMKSHKDTVKALGLKDVSTFKKALIKVNNTELQIPAHLTMHSAMN